MSKKKKKPLKEATLFDDEFTKFMFNYEPAIPETIIRTVMEAVTGKTGIELDRSSMEVEKLLPNPSGHSARYDFFEKSTGSEDYILEIQNNKYTFPPERMDFYISLRDATSLGKGDSYKNLRDTYLIIFSRGDITGHNMAVEWYVYTGVFGKKTLDTRRNIIVVNCDHPDFPEEFKKIELLAKDMKEPGTDKIHNEVIRKTYIEVNKDGGEEVEKPFYTQFEKLRNEIKDKDRIIQDKDKALQDKDKTIQDKDKIIQKQSEELLSSEEKLANALKIIKDNGLAFSG